jgi:hypothetical protein
LFALTVVTQDAEAEYARFALYCRRPAGSAKCGRDGRERDGRERDGGERDGGERDGGERDGGERDGGRDGGDGGERDGSGDRYPAVRPAR